MSKNVFVGIGNVAKKVSKIYVGIGNVAHKVVKAYIGINGIAKQFWPREPIFSSFQSGWIVLKYGAPSLDRTVCMRCSSYLDEDYYTTAYWVSSIDKNGTLNTTSSNNIPRTLTGSTYQNSNVYLANYWEAGVSYHRFYWINPSSLTWSYFDTSTLYSRTVSNSLNSSFLTFNTSTAIVCIHRGSGGGRMAFLFQNGVFNANELNISGCVSNYFDLVSEQCYGTNSRYGVIFSYYSTKSEEYYFGLIDSSGTAGASKTQIDEIPDSTTRINDAIYYAIFEGSNTSETMENAYSISTTGTRNSLGKVASGGYYDNKWDWCNYNDGAIRGKIGAAQSKGYNNYNPGTIEYYNSSFTKETLPTLADPGGEGTYQIASVASDFSICCVTNESSSTYDPAYYCFIS